MSNKFSKVLFAKQGMERHQDTKTGQKRLKLKCWVGCFTIAAAGQGILQSGGVWPTVTMATKGFFFLPSVLLSLLSLSASLSLPLSFSVSLALCLSLFFFEWYWMKVWFTCGVFLRQWLRLGCRVSWPCLHSQSSCSLSARVQELLRVRGWTGASLTAYRIALQKREPPLSGHWFGTASYLSSDLDVMWMPLIEFPCVHYQPVLLIWASVDLCSIFCGPMPVKLQCLSVLVCGGRTMEAVMGLYTAHFLNGCGDTESCWPFLCHEVWVLFRLEQWQTVAAEWKWIWCDKMEAFIALVWNEYEKCNCVKFFKSASSQNNFFGIHFDSGRFMRSHWMDIYDVG